MNAKSLEDAKREATNFLIRVRELQGDPDSMKYLNIVGTRLTSSVRRQSMELTRALAALRRPG